jgi:uncharacterized membrane protein YgcG
MLNRVLRHLVMTEARVARRFPAALLDAVESAVREAERRHGGEIRVALENALPLSAILRGQTSRERAIEVFSSLRVWDTELNNGVLLYVLCADQAIEIVADRAYNGRIDAAAWQQVCATMRVKFQAGDYHGGLLGGIAALSALVAAEFPTPGATTLPDRPVLL